MTYHEREINIFILWDVTSCSLVEIYAYWTLKGSHCLRLSVGRRHSCTKLDGVTVYKPFIVILMFFNSSKHCCVQSDSNVTQFYMH